MKKQTNQPIKEEEIVIPLMSVLIIGDIQLHSNNYSIDKLISFALEMLKDEKLLEYLEVVKNNKKLQGGSSSYID